MTPDSFQSARRRKLVLGLPALVAASGLSAQTADTWPSRQIRILVPYAPGGVTDVIARLLADHLTAALKQTVIVENKPGAAGLIGAETVAHAAPDGYTLMFPAGSVLAFSPLIYKANFDPVKDFTPISMVCSFALVLYANANVPAANIKELTALARNGKQPLSFASGTSGYNLMCENLKLQIGAPGIINVPYGGSGPQIQAVVGGQTDLMIETFSSMKLVKSGKLRALGIFSAERSPSAPDLPTIKEQGVDMVSNGYAALFGPAGMPRAIVQRLEAEVAKFVAIPDVRARMASIDMVPESNTSAQLGAYLVEDIARYKQMIKDTNFKLEK